ncbi:hypothetical protein HA42_13525 [Pantoea deleyi]|nr:hypothetical protein HA42_13525 [Pantoea deleyi]
MTSASVPCRRSGPANVKARRCPTARREVFRNLKAITAVRRRYLITCRADKENLQKKMIKDINR